MSLRANLKINKIAKLGFRNVFLPPHVIAKLISEKCQHLEAPP